MSKEFSEFADFEFKDKNLLIYLQSLKVNLKKFKDHNKKVGNIFSVFVFKDVIDHFEKERGPKRRWQHWSDSYIGKMIKKKKIANMILQDTGRLRNNFKPHKFRSTKNGFLWFNNAKTKKGFPYAAAHNNDEPRKTLPQRKFMWLSAKALTKISDVSLDRLLQDEEI
jgi:phage gpG-like protein